MFVLLLIQPLKKDFLKFLGLQVTLEKNMKKLIAILFLTIPVTVFAASFDCNKASTDVEKAICSDSNLSSLDESLSALYKKTLTIHPDLKASQIEWIKQTRQCEKDSSIADCIKTAYEDRMSYLSSLDTSEMLSDNESIESTGSEGQPAHTNNSEALPLATPEQKLTQSTDKIDQVSAAKDGSNKPEKSSSSFIFVFLLLIVSGIYYFRKRKSTATESSELKAKDVQERPDDIETLFNKGVFLYEKGDFDKAFDFLQEAALKNDAGSQFYLGKILIKNAESRESPSYLKGIDWFRKSAANQYQAAINELNIIDSEKISQSPAKDSLLNEDVSTSSNNKNAAKTLKLHTQQVETAIICDDDTSRLRAAVFYTKSEDGKRAWAYYIGDDGVGGFDVGYVRLEFDEIDNSCLHYYFSYDAESYTEDKISGEDVDVSINDDESSVNQALSKLSEQWLKYDEDDQIFVINSEYANQMLINENNGQKEIFSEEVDMELLALVSNYWPLKYHFAVEESLKEDLVDLAETPHNKNVDECYSAVGAVLGQLESVLEKQKLIKSVAGSNNYECSIFCSKTDNLVKLLVDVYAAGKEISDEKANEICAFVLDEAKKTVDLNANLKNEFENIVFVVLAFNDKEYQFNKTEKESNEDMKKGKNEQFYDYLVELEEHWMEKNVVNSDIIDCGGSIREIHFRFEDEGDGYYLVCELEVEGIDSIPEEVEENISNKVEWAFDDIRESLEDEGLDLESYLGEKVLIKKDDRKKSMLRYVRQNEAGEFLYGVVYSITVDPNGNSLLNGAYYGYVGGGEYDGGYFKIDFEADTHNVLSFDEAESSESFESLEPLMAECGSFYDNEDESYELTDYAKSLLSNGIQDGDDVIYMDEDFDGDALSEISEQWVISLRFES